MSGKKNLLNESQVRQFMKLARLEPLSPGFVEGLSTAPSEEEELEESTEEEGSEDELEETHGRGSNELNDSPAPHRGGGVKLSEAAADPEALEDYAAGDLERGHPEEAEVDELEADMDLGDEIEVGAEEEGEMLSRAEVLSVFEKALEELFPAEAVDVVDDEAPDEFDPAGPDVVDDELEVELSERGKATDEIVEQITKRVAARILKSALAKKK
jgi:hypothetical protein